MFGFVCFDRAGIALARSHLFMYKNKHLNVPLIFTRLAQEQGDRAMFLYKDEQWSFKNIDQFSNRVGNAFASLGFQPGDEVALIMNSRPEFVGIWLGMAKSGIVTAFINTNQRMETLVHSITVVNCKAVIFETNLAPSKLTNSFVQPGTNPIYVYRH